MNDGFEGVGCSVLAVGAHPDDIEFMMAGTMLMLKERGASLVMWSLSDGSLGSARMSREETARVRRIEMEESARVASAATRPPLFGDMELIYQPDTLSPVAEIIGEVKPDVMLVHGPDDYSEDHVNACRIAVAGAFAAAVENARVSGGEKTWSGDIFVYHAMPYGLRDMFGRIVEATHYVDIARVFEKKSEMLLCHRSQAEWLEQSQGLESPVTSMESMCREMGNRSGAYAIAEGWRKHNHLGFSERDGDPLKEILRDSCRLGVALDRRKKDEGATDRTRESGNDIHGNA